MLGASKPPANSIDTLTCLAGDLNLPGWVGHGPGSELGGWSPGRRRRQRAKIAGMLVVGGRCRPLRPRSAVPGDVGHRPGTSRSAVSDRDANDADRSAPQRCRPTSTTGTRPGAVINRALRRVLTTLRDDNNQDTFRLYLWTDRKQQLEPMVSSHTPNGHRDPNTVLSDLGQLQPGGANILILDVTREFLIAPRIERECNAPNGVFERHPELSAVAVSAWGVFPAPTMNPLVDEVFIEEYDLIPNPHASWPMPPELLSAMQRPGLLG